MLFCAALRGHLSARACVCVGGGYLSFCCVIVSIACICFIIPFFHFPLFNTKRKTSPCLNKQGVPQPHTSKLMGKKHEKCWFEYNKCLALIGTWIGRSNWVFGFSIGLSCFMFICCVSNHLVRSSLPAYLREPKFTRISFIFLSCTLRSCHAYAYSEVLELWNVFEHYSWLSPLISYVGRAVVLLSLVQPLRFDHMDRSFFAVR